MNKKYNDKNKTLEDKFETKVFHKYLEHIKADVEDFIENHFWTSRQKFKEINGESIPKDWSQFRIDIEIKKIK